MWPGVPPDGTPGEYAQSDRPGHKPPLRLDLLQLLGAGGPATAAQCGRVLGASQASCSFHPRQSLDRMVALAGSHAVTHVLGCHIEMTRQPGHDYPLGAAYQPDEQALQMTVAQLKQVRAAAASVAGQRGVYRFDDFVIYNQPGPRDQLKLIAQGLLHKIRARSRA